MTVGINPDFGGVEAGKKVWCYIMSWEQGRYYTRSKRSGGRIVREYIGSGDVAELLAKIDARDAEEREAELARRRERRAADEALEGEIDEFCLLVEAAAHAELMEAGFHFHRGRWRKRRKDHARYK